MHHQSHHTVFQYSDSSSEFDKSEDELSNETYYHELRNSTPRSESRIFRRWLLTIIDIPNSLTNRLRDWLRPTPESRGSTSEKSSGTNSINSNGIQLTGHSDSDGYFYNEKFEKSIKHNYRHHHGPTRKNGHSPNTSRRYVNNHHIYHIYKQNEMGIKHVVGGHRNYSTSWLQRNGRFSSSPVLVLPRIDPDTGLPIFQPRTDHSTTATEHRSVTHREENLKCEDWRNTGIWKFQENHYTRLRGDTGNIEGFIDKQTIEKSPTVVKKCNEKTLDHNQDYENDLKQVELAKLRKLNATGTTAFRERISMRLEMEKPRSLVETIKKKDLNSNKIEEKIEIKDTEPNGFRDLQKISTVTQNNVDALLNNLRQKMYSLNVEKKFKRPVVRLSRIIDSETGSQDRDHLFGTHWQDKSGLFVRDIKPAYTETRASFTERIQDIWTQEKTASQWAIVHNHKNTIHGKNSQIEREKDVEEEKEIIFSESTTNEISKGNRILKMSTTQSSINYEISKPTVCHIGVQYNIPDSINTTKSLRPSSSQYILTLRDNKEQSGMQIPQIPKAFTESNEIQTNSIQLPPPQKIQAFLQYEVSKVAKDFISPQPVILLESKASTEILDPLTEQNVRKTLSANKNVSSNNVNAKDSQFTFPSQEIPAFIDYDISELATAKKLDPLKEQNVQNTRSLENIYSQNINENSQLAFQGQQKRLRCPFAGLRKIRLKSSIHFSRSPFRNPRKSRIFKYRFPKKVSLWLTSKFHSGNQRISTISIDESRSLHSTKSSKLSCTMRSIFKCIKKTSEINMPQELVKKGYPVPTIFQSNVRLMSQITQTNHGTQSSTVKTINLGYTDEENDADTIYETKYPAEEIAVDLNAIEPAASSNRRTPSKSSMTTLSVTTSNSTNVPLQLLGSTSDTNIVPSHDSQDDPKRQVNDSNGTEIITRNRKIVTCEETDHYNSVSLLSEVPAEDNRILGKLEDDRKIKDSSETMKNCKKILIDIPSDYINEEFKLERKTRNPDVTRGLRKPKEHILIARKRKKGDKAINNVNIDKKYFLDIEHFSTRRNILSKTKINISDKSAGEKKMEKQRLERHTSRIDMIIDNSPRTESNSESPEIRNAYNRRLVRRESMMNIGADDSSNKADLLKPRERKEVYNYREDSSMRLESTCTTKRLKQRIDSPMIPRRSTGSQKRRSSLIPVGIENSRCLSTMRKACEENAATDTCNWTKLNENKNQISAMNSSLIARPSLKKNLENCSESKGKRNSNNRVRFELEKQSSNETELKVIKDRKKRMDFSKNVLSRSLHIPQRIDDKKIVRKIKSSLENGLPLKRITIMEPYAVYKKTKQSGATKSEVEKDFIGQAGELCSIKQNLTRRERTRLITQVDSETVYQTYPRIESSLSKQIPKPSDSFEKRHHNENNISYRSLLIERNKNNDVTLYPVKRSTECLPGSIKSERSETLGRQSIIDFAKIREQVENEILEKTSRSSGTEDCDCAIILIKAINSSMELSDT